MTISDRELEILTLIAKEYTTEKIANALNISVSTVETHRRNLFQKMEVSSVAGLIKEAFRRNYITI